MSTEDDREQRKGVTYGKTENEILLFVTAK
jgi:hypothetical protein